MTYAIKFAGTRYVLSNKGKWKDQCPYFIGHKSGISEWQHKLRFKKWHRIGMKVRGRFNAKPYRLFWRLHPNAQRK